MDKFDKMSILEESIALNTRPHPHDFVIYVPWACNQLEIEHIVIVVKVYQSDYAGTSNERSKPRSKSKTKPAQSRADAVSDRDDNKTVITQQVSFVDDAINITAVHDTNEDLVQIVFNNNKFIPRLLLKVIALIVKFHPQLNSIIVNKGADLYTVHELKKILPISNITEINLDDCPIDGANYDILLDYESLRILSLCRCRIIDDDVRNIAAKLIFPCPASKSLYVLILTSNRITDVGATYLADTLRSNRCLTYLNLSDNWITDEGAVGILNSLQEFCLTPEEVLSSKTRNISYLKKRTELIETKMKELKEGDLERAAKKKTGRSTPTSVRKKKPMEREGSFQSVRDAISLNSSNPNLLERALTIIQTSLGDFNDPFSSTNTIVKDGTLFCLGNNTLCYLNIAFNDLSYIFLNKLVNVLSYQKQVDRRPCGLINVSIEGNNMPVTCEEFKLINQILESNLQRGHPASKRRHTKTSAR